MSQLEPKYFTVGDLLKKDRGKKAVKPNWKKSKRTKVYNAVYNGAQSQSRMFLCARKSKEPPEEPICDILVAGGPNRKTVMDSLKKRGGPFDFKEIRVFNPDKLHKNGFINQGLAYSQYGTWTRSEANLYPGWCKKGMKIPQCKNALLAKILPLCKYPPKYTRPPLAGQIDSCKAIFVLTTSRGCNIPAMPKSKAAKCVSFTQTSGATSAYGSVVKELGCDTKITEDMSGWCNCISADNKSEFPHAVKSAVRNPIGKTFTCKEECESPTWVPAIKDVKMEYSPDTIGVVPKDDPSHKQKGAHGWIAQHHARARYSDGDHFNFRPAKCPSGFLNAEKLEVDGVRDTCSISLNTGFTRKAGKQIPSRLCVKR
jgi:hypothetical protein